FDATRTQFDSDANGSIDTKTKASGLGNPSFSVKYTMVRDPNVSVRVIAKLPTGYEAGVDYPEGDLDLAYSVSLGAVDLHLQAGYQYTGEDRNKVNPTDAVVANAALARSIGENFVLFTELNYRQAGGPLDTAPQPNALGVKEEAPTQKILDVTPGFKARFKESFLFSAAARISIINDFVFGYDYSYLTLLSYIF
ncbi:MAG TPA: transporter, partial [Candidatus Manganitrophaceae bacterium]|nr:transporter [Candidatus Manganitrophaceae bacterium]